MSEVVTVDAGDANVHVDGGPFLVRVGGSPSGSVAVTVPDTAVAVHVGGAVVGVVVPPAGVAVGFPGPQGPPGTPGGPTGPAGPSAVSTDPANLAVLGTDGLVYVPPWGSNEVLVTAGTVPLGVGGELWVDTTAEPAVMGDARIEQLEAIVGELMADFQRIFGSREGE